MNNKVYLFQVAALCLYSGNYEAIGNHYYVNSFTRVWRNAG